jgi:hypothetical protein
LTLRLETDVESLTRVQKRRIFEGEGIALAKQTGTENVTLR